MTLVQEADEFADKAHRMVGQRRNYTREPYIVHPRAVAKMVKNVGGSEEMVAAALLHDTVEDTNVSLQEIEETFGHEVAELVEWLTDFETHEDGNREYRKRMSRERLAKAPPEAKTIKLADLIDNTSTITKFDPDFSKVYMREKRELLEVLKDGNETLYQQAQALVNEYFEQEGK